MIGAVPPRHPQRGSVMAGSSPPSRGRPRRGALIGLGVLILLFGDCLLRLCTSSFNDPGPTDPDITGFFRLRLSLDRMTRVQANPTPALPPIDPATPLARLLPAPPPVRQAPVYLGSDLASAPELMLEAA